MDNYIQTDKKKFALKVLIPTIILSGHYYLAIFLITINSNELPQLKGVEIFGVGIFVLGVIIFRKINLLFDNTLENVFVDVYKGMEYELIENQIFIKQDCITENIDIEEIQNIIFQNNYFIININDREFVVPLNYKQDDILKNIMEDIKITR